MSIAIKPKSLRKPTLRGLGNEVARLRARVEELEDLRDLNGAIARNGKRSGVPWEKAKNILDLH